MKLVRLIELHRLNTPSSALEKNLGDGFLVKNNRYFRNIRKQALADGYSFTNQPTTDFQALPLSQLENILTEKKIPYLDNVSILEKLVSKLNDRVTWDDIVDGYKRNYVFHESCHAVARTDSEKFTGPKTDLSTLHGQQLKCLRILIEESFANTCELLAVTQAQDPAHKLFFTMSSYTALFDSRTFLNTAIEKFGEAIVFKFFLYSYLHANFLKGDLGDKQFQKVLYLSGYEGASKSTDKDLKNLRILSKIPFTLDLRFRTSTTGLHLLLSGLSFDSKQLLNFDFLETIKNDSSSQKMINSLTKKVLV